jgi:dUTP pyrophosphatase
VRQKERRNILNPERYRSRVKYKKLTETAKEPTSGSVGAAGLDLYADLGELDGILIQPHTTCKIGTGIAMQIPEGFFGGIYARSGLATKKGLRPANAVGIVDAEMM